MELLPQTRRFLGGRQPLCGIGVMSVMEVTLMPRAFRARTDDSRPGPGPLMRTSRVLMPWSSATRPAFSAATWAANGVDLREPRKPAPPAVAQLSVLPWRSVMVTMVLLNEAWTCAMPSVTTRLIFFLPLAAAGLLMDGRLYFLMARRGPLRVRALVRVRWPRTGRPLR